MGNRVSAQCDAAFTRNSCLYVGDTVSFHSTNSYTTSTFHFGDGDSALSNSPQHIYGTAGSFIVRRIVNQVVPACSDTAYDTLQILTRPDHYFSVDQNCADDTAFFTLNTQLDAADSIQNIRWYFGDGDSSELPEPGHRYQKSGTYQIRYRIQTRFCELTKDTVVFIKTAPLADFSVTGNGCFNDTLHFSFTGDAVDPEFDWNFDDEFSGSANEDTTANPSHSFTAAGTYQVRLVLTDTLGCSDTLTQAVTVAPLPSADFDITFPCLGSRTAFNSSSTPGTGDSIVGYYWDLGDGDTASAMSFEHLYADTGSRQVQLIITSALGCIDTAMESVRIRPRPLIDADDTTICQETSVQFSSNLQGETAGTYTWRFGDGFTGNTAAPLHQYEDSGTFRPYLRITYPDGYRCHSDSLQISAFPLPSAEFLINQDTQCFIGNEVCVHLIDQPENILSRRVLFDDGFVDVASSPTDTSVCYSYSATDGGLYSITVQLVDSNSCSKSYTNPNQVLIYEDLDVAFTQSGDSGCFETTIEFNNTSSASPPDVTDFYWDFGDGTRDSTNWDTTNHTYTTDGSFTIKLVAQNQNGCIDSFTSSGAVYNVDFVVDGTIDSVVNECASNNVVYASQTIVPGSVIRWVWGTEDTASSSSISYRYEDPGVYRPYVVISKEGCDSTVFLDTITIKGPLAVINPITNQYQCEIHDTVRARNASIYFQNSHQGAFWDFGDGFSASCTTDTDNGLNVGGDCRYSVDNPWASHMYEKGEENCYTITLIAFDSVSGCRDTVRSSVSLAPPEAGPDGPLAGLQLYNTQTCLGPEEEKMFELNLSAVQPTCGRQTFWVMWDSACAVASGNFDSAWRQLDYEHNYTYDNPPCDPNGYVTLGLIVQNGSDSAGNICRDTAWYHRMLQFQFMDPGFTSDYNNAQYYCTGSTFTFTLDDTTQSDVTSITWDFGDGTDSTTSNLGSISHQFNEPGIYTVLSRVTTANGCVGTDTGTVAVGLSQSISLSTTQLCKSDSLYLTEDIRYFNDTTAYWSDSSRSVAGKEQLWFNFNDGQGYQSLSTSNPFYLFDEAGDYVLQVAIRDSTGCLDTLTLTDTIRVFSIEAAFTTTNDTFICAQAVAFTNGSSVYDSTAGFAQANDGILTNQWSFLPGSITSSLENPEVFLNVGDYNVRLISTNSIGCQDSAFRNLTLIGPQASFTIVSDTVGCQPYSIEFENQSTNSNSFFWRFNDSANTVYNTNSDTNFTFTYEDYGTFQPTLTAQGTFVQNGISTTCEDVFPDSTETSIRLVTINETPEAAFEFTTDCATRTVDFTNTTLLASTTLDSFYWEFGDGDTSPQENPSHQYADTGRYSVILHVFTGSGCEDTTLVEVTVAPNPAVWFSYNEVCVGTTTLFEDSTDAFNDVIYDWTWTFGDGGSSTLENPFHLFAKDTFYNVQLKVINIAGCTDSVTRTIRIHSFPAASFTNSPVCDYTAATFTNTSTNSELPLYSTWNFGDGNTDTATNPDHLYASAGIYTVDLQVESPWGCADSTTGTQTVFESPQSGMSINQQVQCDQEQAFVFQDSGQYGDGITTRTWTLGDASTSTDSIVNYQYSNPGSYPVRLILTSSLSCSDTAYDTVRVDPSPTAQIHLNDAAQCLNLNAFALADQSLISSDSYSRLWNLGDGNSRADSSFTHTYADTGDYSISLRVNSDLGCSDSVQLTVRVNEVPVADFSINDTGQCLTDNYFLFTNSSSVSQGNLSYIWTLGDGTVTGIISPDHSYSLDSTYQIQLIASTDSSCRDTTTATITTFPMPVADFSINDSAQCLNAQSFEFSDSSSIASGSLSLRWYFGDGDSSTAQNATHAYSADGLFSARLIATSNESCGDTLNKDIIVHPIPEPGFLINDTAQCYSGHSFTFTDTSVINSGTFTRLWNNSDTTTSTDSQYVHSYSTYGTRDIELELTSDFGCLDSLTKTIEVFPMPEAGFSINDTGQCLLGNSFSSTNNSTIPYGNLSYSWWFEDGDSIVGPTATYSYDDFGHPELRLWAESDEGCADSAFLTLHVLAMPEAKIGLADSSLCFRDHEFNLVDSSGIGEGTYTRFWDFGDGSTDTASIVRHSYAAFGTYTATLYLESDSGCLDTAERLYTVHPQAVSAFSIADSIQCFDDHTFQFVNGSTLAQGNLSYRWSFGDGDTSNLQDPSKQYAVYGPYSIQLIANTDFGCRDTSSSSLRIDPNPATNFAVNDTGQCINTQSFEFTDQSTIAQGTYSRLWDFGDLSTDTSADPIHQYAGEQSYSVWLVLTSDLNCKDSMQMDIAVHPKPQPDFSINDSAQCINTNDFAFTNLTSISAGTMTYNWTFGDANSSVQESPRYTYAMDDTFDVQVLATSDLGCLDSILKQTIVFPKPEVSFIINDSAQCVNTQDVQFTGTSTITSGIIAHHYWDLNAALDTGDLDTFYHYPAFGTYRIRFLAESEMGCFDTAFSQVVIHPKPYADFTVNDSTQCENTDDYQFTNLTTISSGTLSYLWDFGDGQASIQEDPNYSYQGPDSLNVILYAYSSFNCYDTAIHQAIIFPKPDVDFSINDTGQCLNGNQFLFTNNTTIDYGFMNYLWDLDNGTTTQNVNQSYVFPTHGTYNIKLKVTSTSQCTDSLIKPVVVFPRPIPDFAVNDPGQCINTQDFQFTDLSSIASGNLHYRWEFGFGNFDTTPGNVNYHFVDFGRQTVELYLESDFGCKDSTNAEIRVFPKPEASFTTNRDQQCLNTQDFEFFSGSRIPLGTLIEQLWDLDDGNIAFGSLAEHTYQNSGIYRVELIVTSDSLCRDTADQFIRVFPQPTARFEYNDSAQCLTTQDYQFHSLSFDSSGISEWYYYLDPLNRFNDSNFNFVFNTTGLKTIQHQVTSFNGCKDTIERSVYVKPMPDPSFTGLGSFHCQNEPAFDLLPNTPGGTFSGKNINSLQQFEPIILWSDTVKYWVEVDGCADSSFEYTEVFPVPVVDLGPDTVLCKTEFMPFDVSFWESRYKWSTGNEEPVYMISNPGRYWVSVTNVCGVASDTLNVAFRDQNCRVYVPTAFTPNNDIYNDRYKPWHEDVDEMDYFIFNRWGQMVYQGDLDDEGWDGMFQGSPAQQDVYIVVVKYKYTILGQQITGEDKVNMTLLR